MAEGLPSFLKEDHTKLIFCAKDKELVAYIPEKFFERSIATVIGEYIELLGIFNYTVQDLNTHKNIGLKTFRFPTIFTTMPSVTEKVKDVQLMKDIDAADYRILRYREGDEFVVSTDVVQSIANVEKFINLFYVLGFIPNTIPYNEIHEYIMDNMSLNGNSYGVNAQMFGFTISELCRSKKDQNVPFRLSGSSNPHEYKSMSIKNISKLISPYTAIISEDFDESLLYAMLNDNPKDTPLEEILVGE